MELPVVVQQALGENAMGVSLRSVNQVKPEYLLRMVLLNDSQGNLQAICRRDDMLDLEALNKSLGRDLRMMQRREQMRVRQRAGLQELPALPSLTGWPTVIDRRVEELEFVALELADEKLSIMMPAEEFR